MATPKDAAAVVLLKNPDDPCIFWVKRSPKLMFMGGYHAFPGGQLDRQDSSIPTSNCEPGPPTVMRACAVREFFEETGVLLASGTERLDQDHLASKRRALISDQKTFSQLLEEDDLSIDGSMLTEAGRWVTPPFAPRRFDTWFFLAWLPEGQEPRVESGELEMGEWISPADALARWKNDDVIVAPPVLHIIKTLDANSNRLDDVHRELTAIPEARRAVVRRIEFRPGIFLFPVRTPTLPPATHTNCYIVGGDELIVIDPASVYEEEQHALDLFIDSLAAEGRRVREILLTHHHADHVGGVNHLKSRIRVPVSAHRLTAERLSRSITVDRFVEDGDLIDLAGDPGWRLRALHTPGHTRGHLCFYEERSAVILTGDLVVGLGTVVIDPPEGNMKQYFASLHRLLELPRLSSLFPAHGPVIGSAALKIEEYINHRSEREGKILGAVRAGKSTPAAIVQQAYTDVSPELYSLAERSTLAHLEKLAEEGLVKRYDGGLYRPGN